MRGNILLLLPILFPVAAGILVLIGKGFGANRSRLAGVVFLALAASAAFTGLALAKGGSLTLWQLTDYAVIEFCIDQVAGLFAVLTAVVWLLVGLYSFSYMVHEREEYQFFGWYLIVLGVLVGLDFSGNLITFYVCYELMTLTSLPLVLHERTKEAVMAGLKYLFYSVAGAFLALFGIFFLVTVCPSLDFAPGGVIDSGRIAGKENLFLAAVCCMIIGFGTKAGMFPLHGWLPTAHPVAPAPASAVLSGVITKSGVLALIRVVYFIAGPNQLRGTWVQQIWLLLTLLTVFMGSMLAYKERILKKRLAYSTVSQVSYILFGLSLLEPVAFVGALAHVVFHSLVKNALFLTAGAVIFYTGWTKVNQMKGLGKVMPVMLSCYTLVSLSLVGIPPTSGFISKWYLAQGALSSGTGAWAWLGPAVLLVSALLTAGYLLPLTIDGFFPGTDFDETELKTRKLYKKEPSWQMLIPVFVLTAGAVGFGCFPGPFLNLLTGIAKAVF
ncbi:MAG: proton-conducting membrane transporter [Lachnospiraceae bacterium]|jgi:formate hydrogenlyase subunit 3/multisubunit Na+/H+ antiporter MnhD subunit|nr:proton-conducting membrane transporter [Lachnospiraceae bacterium]